MLSSAGHWIKAPFTRLVAGLPASSPEGSVKEGLIDSVRVARERFKICSRSRVVVRALTPSMVDVAASSVASLRVRSWTRIRSAANAPIISMTEAVRVRRNVIFGHAKLRTLAH